MSHLTVFTDGGSRGNPGESAYGFVVYEGEHKIWGEGKHIGIQTNNFAEYTAVIKALEWVRENCGEDLTIKLYCDSLLVASQLNGSYKVKNLVIKQLYRRVKSLESFFKSVSYSHIPRSKNFEADSFVNKALDAIS